MAQQRLDLAAQVDAGLHDTDAHAELQQHDAGARTAQERRTVVVDDHRVRDEHIVEDAGKGTGTFERGEMGRQAQRETLHAAIDQGHHRTLTCTLELEQRAEDVVLAQIRHPGQRPVDDITAIDALALETQFLDASKRLHCVRHAGATEYLAA